MKKIKKIKEQILNWNPSTYVCILMLTIPFMVYMFSTYKLDNDFSFIANVGRYILKNGFITTEPFTIHSGFFFIPQQWLSAVIFYLIYSKFGIVGMITLTIIVNSVIILLLYKIAILITKDKMKSIIITIFVDILFNVIGIITTRPQVFDIILLLLQVLIIELYIDKKNYKYLYLLPLISIAFINLHASIWPMMFVFLLPYYGEYVLKKLKKEETFHIKHLVINTILIGLCGLINPYHIHSVTYLFNSFGVEEINNFITEMKPINIYLIKLFILIFVGLVLIYKNKGKNKERYILFFLGTTYLMLSHLKGSLFFLIGFFLILCQSLKGKQKKKVKYSPNLKEKIIYIGLFIIMASIICLNIHYEENKSLVPILNYLNKNANKNIKLYTEYDDGGYFEYHGYKCYIDSRAEVFLKSNNKKKDIYPEYYKMKTGLIDTQEFLNKYNFDYLEVNKNSRFLLKELKNNSNYKQVVKTSSTYFKEKETYYLYKRIK